MDKIIILILFIIMLVAFLANPAPVSIEVDDLLLIALPAFLGLLSLFSMKGYTLYQPECNLLITIMIYLSYLLISMLIGLVHGAPLLNSLRSLGPYINFFPLLLLGLLPARTLRPWVIGCIFILVGMLQAGYQFYLYFTHYHGGAGTLDVLRSRITLIEPRTTLPIVLSITILPMALLTHKNMYFKFISIALIMLGLFAGAATLTRSIIISIMAGWITYLIVYLRFQSFSGSFSFMRTFGRFCMYFLTFILFVILISFIPKIYMLEQGLLARFYYQASAAHSIDYTNGRLYDEWVPALSAWVNSGLFGLLFGIGAGNVFTVATGEERTYIHNLIIYCLVYGGIYGLFACLWLYFTLFKTLIIRARQSGQIIYIGFASLLMSLFTYAQLFAVHKGLAFNAMLFLIMALALAQPAYKRM